MCVCVCIGIPDLSLVGACLSNVEHKSTYSSSMSNQHEEKMKLDFCNQKTIHSNFKKTLLCEHLNESHFLLHMHTNIADV